MIFIGLVLTFSSYANTPASHSTGGEIDKTKLKQRYIIQLEDPAISTYLINSSKSKQALNKTSKQSNLVKSYRTKLITNQQGFIQTLRSSIPNMAVHASYQSLLNGLAVSATQDEVTKLAKTQGVKKIYPDRLRYVHLDQSHNLIGSTAAWQEIGGQSEAGKGLKIAIIDSGIRNDNPMFFDDGFSAPDLSNNSYLTENPDYCRASDGDPEFCNNKIIVARWVDPFAHALMDNESGQLGIVNIDPNEHMSPLGHNRHGSHVAGIAAGNPVQIEYQGVPVTLSGVAPGSYLMIYKALFSSHGSTFGSDSMLLEALEHAVNDGADVINNSWGSYAAEQPEDSVYADVYANAESLGITIVNSAGNSGIVEGGSINCPGCIESGITVANTMHGRFFGHRITVDNTSFIGVQGEAAALPSDYSLSLRAYSEIGANFTGACEYPFNEPTFENAAVLVNYLGDCDLSRVVENVRLAGGDMAIIYQYAVADTQARSPFKPYELDYAIPVLGVSRATGIALSNKSHSSQAIINIDASTSSYIDPDFFDIVNLSSSMGPNKNPNVLKPDLAAPGTHILSASAPVVENIPDLPGLPGMPDPISTPAEPQEPSYIAISGTSMSSPHVAGAVALLKQAHPSWNTTQIKSALTSTAYHNITAAGEQATPFNIGSGRMQINAAINAALTFDKVSYANAACIGQCYFRDRLQNMTSSAGQWYVSVELDNNAAIASVNQESFTLDAHGETNDSAEFEIKFTTTDVEPGTWVFGRIVLSSSTQPEQHIAVAIHANDNADNSALSTSADATNPSDGIIMHTKVRNFDFTTSPVLTITLPPNASLITNSEQADLVRGQTDEFDYQQQSNQLTWKGQLEQGEMTLAPQEAWGNQSLDSMGVPAISCDGSCSDFSQVIEFDFEFNGKQYSQLILSSQGYIVAGENQSNLYSAQRFPQPDEVNNIIAPLWARYIYQQQNNEDEFPGFEAPIQANNSAIRQTVRTIDGLEYLIVEWDSVKTYLVDDNGAPAPEYTFQVIIQKNSDNIWFNYLSIPSMPQFASIGAEDSEALVGVDYYFNGEGTPLPNPLPENGYSLKLETQATGEANISFALALEDGQGSTNIDEFDIVEDTQVELDLLANDRGSVDIKVDVELEAGITHQTSRLIKASNVLTLDSSSLEITQQPANGTASVSQGKVIYTPLDNYAGADAFYYRVADDKGVLSVATAVELNIVNTNDVPVVSVEPNSEARAGESVTLVATVTDPDDTDIQLTWRQTAGTIVEFEQQGQSLVFSLPSDFDSQQLIFAVFASDGESQSEEATTSIDVKRINGGGIGLMSIFLTLILLSRLGYKFNKVRAIT
nr:S8 family serine peptidase [Paraglaciecola sp. G1-23]